MLLGTTLLCLFSANLVISQYAKPEILADYDPSTTLVPLKGNLQNSDPPDDLHVIRGLLRSRQSSCPAGYGECTNPAGRCCPLGGSCCQSYGCCQSGYFCYSTGCCPAGTKGCQGTSCCTSGQSCCSGGGCCDSGYTCAVVDGQRGCCPNGKDCNTPQCATPGYVVCSGQNFCCPPGYTCLRDSGGNPECSPPNNNPPPPLTDANPNTNLPNPNGSTGTVLGNPAPSSVPPAAPSSNSNNKGAVSSSVVSVAIDAALTLFAGFGIFVYLY